MELGQDENERKTKNKITLISIEIPPLVVSIEESAFEGCSSLNEIIIPKSIKHISDYAFKNCSYNVRSNIKYYEI